MWGSEFREIREFQISWILGILDQISLALATQVVVVGHSWVAHCSHAVQQNGERKVCKPGSYWD